MILDADMEAYAHLHRYLPLTRTTCGESDHGPLRDPTDSNEKVIINKTAWNENRNIQVVYPVDCQLQKEACAMKLSGVMVRVWFIMNSCTGSRTM